LGIAAGPDGSIWFTVLPGQIARISELAAICTPSEKFLCLDNGRFRVAATWAKSDGSLSVANAVPLGASSTAGYLWFFSSEAPELTVKIVEGCAFNGAVWFFAGGLTDVGVVITVTDYAAPLGPVSKIYLSPPGSPFAPIQDTRAFPCAAASAPPPPHP
jgi:hypothetical protein